MKPSSRQKATRIATYVASAFLLAVVLANLFGLISLRLVQTNSMQGTIDVGDLVVSQNWLKPKVGDIAIYHAHNFQGLPAADVVHRVIAGDQTNGYTFQGDNNQSADSELVSASSVVGVVSFWIPGVAALANPLVLLVLASAISVLVFSRGYIKDAFGKLSSWVQTRGSRVRKLWLTALGLCSIWLVIAGLSVAGLLRIEHPQVGPNLALGSASTSLVVVLPHSNAGVGDIAVANITGKRNFVRIDAVNGSTLTISSSMGKLLISRKDVEGPIRFVLPFVGALWLPFD